MGNNMMFRSVQSMNNHLHSLNEKVNKDVNTSVTIDFEVTKMDEGDWKSVPIIINNYNRKKYLKKQISYLKGNGYENIYVIDNKSSYQPLLDYYKEQSLKVFYLSDNVGYLALWQTAVYDHFMDSYYVYTDSDVVPSDSTPSNFIEVFSEILENYTFLDKVGFSLEIEDLPDESLLTKDIVEHELKFWIYDIDNKFYFSPIDTTFALYRPHSKGGWWLNSGRVKKPYIAQHLPWYEGVKSLSEEDRFYYKSINRSTHWSDAAKKSTFINRIKSTLKKIIKK